MNNSPDDIARWVAELNRNVYDEWKIHYSDWKPGFHTFVGSPIPEPTLAIITLNPGGTENDFAASRKRFESGDFRSSKNAPYFGSSAMQAAIQALFDQHLDTLYYRAVAFYAFFFRSRTWNDIPRAMRQEMKRFCFPLVKKILENFQPKGILVIGFKTFGYLDLAILGNNGIGVFSEQIPFKRKGSADRLFEESRWKAQWGVVPTFTTLHLTGARGITVDEKSTLSGKFGQWLVREGLAGE